MSAPRRIAVTDAQLPIAAPIMDALRACSDVEFVGGVVTRKGARVPHARDLATIPLSADHREFVAYLRSHAIDTVVQCGLAPDRSGRRRSCTEADVIGTMCTGAAVGHEDVRIRSWVALSTTGVYPIDSYASLMQREDASRAIDPASPEASIAEAEDYARDVALRNPQINVSILRLQQLVGDGLNGALSRVFAGESVPVPIGFDPPIQFLHVEDAAAAVCFAVLHELAGVFNVASEGQIRWAAAARTVDGDETPVLPVSASALSPLLDRFSVAHLTDDVIALARFGQVVDTAKIERAGFRPKHDQRTCVQAMRKARAETPRAGSATGSPRRENEQRWR